MPNFDSEGNYVRDSLARVRMHPFDCDNTDPGEQLFHITSDADAPQQVKDVLEHLLPIWLDLFQMKSREYGEAAHDLGPKAQFVDMSRKFVKLRRAMWEGQELTTEGVDEILLDLIGHCFLTLEMRRRAGELGR